MSFEWKGIDLIFWCFALIQKKLIFDTQQILVLNSCSSFKLQEYIDHTFEDQLTGFTIDFMVDHRNANFCSLIWI